MRTRDQVLAGRSVVLTAQRRADDLAAALERRGGVVHHAPTLGVVKHVDEDELLARTREIVSEPPDVLVVTTGVGFRGWLETAGTHGLDGALVEALRSTRLLARGSKADGAMQGAGLSVDWVAGSETAAEVSELLTTEGVDGLRIAVQQHAAGDDGLARVLTGSGATVLPLVVYRWGPPPDPDAVDRSVLEVARGIHDAVVFTSAPGVVAWLVAVDRLGVVDEVHQHVASGRTVLAAVGPVTAAPLTERGLASLVPERSRMGALLRTLTTELSARGGGDV